MAVAKRIGKIAALFGVCHGFVGNRMLEAQSNARRKSLTSKAPCPWDVDRVHLRFRPADGAVRDERPRGPRHWLVEGNNTELLDGAGNPL